MGDGRLASGPDRPEAGILGVLLERIDMALSKKKRVGKSTISAKQVRKTASGRKRRKADGTQPQKVVFPNPAPVAA